MAIMTGVLPASYGQIDQMRRIRKAELARQEKEGLR